MERNCNFCKKYFECNLSKFIPFPQNGCSDFVSAKKKKYVALHIYISTGFVSVVEFGDDMILLTDICKCQRHYGSKNHAYIVVSNYGNEQGLMKELEQIKDDSLLNLCNNIAFYLARAEYNMLKHRYIKSKLCFDSAKSLISSACYILDNY